MAPPHVVIFPFMSKGHTIPLLHLARLLLCRGTTITIVTTPLNAPFIRQHITGTEVSVVEIPFPKNIPELLPGIESTDKLPSISLFVPFANATKLMQPELDELLKTLPNVACVISDGFLGWTQKSAEKIGVPRYVSYGMNNYSSAVFLGIMRDRPHASVQSDDEPFALPDFPWIKLTKNDLEPPFNDPEPKGSVFEFVIEQAMAYMKSNGYLVNSFYDLEPKFVVYRVKECGLKIFSVGPLCLAKPPKAKKKQKPMWIQWLDEKLEQKRLVLYVAFGTQAEISEEQLEEIAVGLEKSGVDFIWVVRSIGSEKLNGCKESVKERGLIVSEWVDQLEILNHESVSGFMSHCGWNSVMESICASVPILAMPMMAEQHVNARLVVEELGIGVRVLALNGSVRGFVGRDCIEQKVKELMEGEKAKEMKKKAEEFGELARKAMQEGGSSWCTLGELVNDFCIQKGKIA